MESASAIWYQNEVSRVCRQTLDEVMEDASKTMESTPEETGESMEACQPETKEDQPRLPEVETVVASLDVPSKLTAQACLEDVDEKPVAGGKRGVSRQSLGGAESIQPDAQGPSLRRNVSSLSRPAAIISGSSARGVGSMS